MFINIYKWFRILLYEAVDLAWNFGGMTYRGVKNVYNWYYEVPTR